MANCCRRGATGAGQGLPVPRMNPHTRLQYGTSTTSWLHGGERLD